MLIYNTTYHVELADARNFVIWLHECYIPEAEKSGELKNPRVLRILSHKEQDSECFSMQWEVEDSAALHRWHTQVGARLNDELMKTFKRQGDRFPHLDGGHCVIQPVKEKIILGIDPGTNIMGTGC